MRGHQTGTAANPGEDEKLLSQLLTAVLGGSPAIRPLVIFASKDSSSMFMQRACIVTCLAAEIWKAPSTSTVPEIACTSMLTVKRVIGR